MIFHCIYLHVHVDIREIVMHDIFFFLSFFFFTVCQVVKQSKKFSHLWGSSWQAGQMINSCLMELVYLSHLCNYLLWRI